MRHVGRNWRSEQEIFDHWGGKWRCGGWRVHRLWIADVSRGRDNGRRDGHTVVVPGHVLRTVRGDHGAGGDHGGRRYQRGGKGHGNSGRGGDGHGGQAACDDDEQTLKINRNIIQFG